MNDFSDPKKVVAEVGINSGSTVVDLGAGSGAYSFAAAGAARNVKVYAVEVQKELVETLNREAADRHVGNIEVIWGDIERKGGTKIGDGVADAVFICNVLFQAEDKAGIAHEACRILKRGGRAIIIEWADSFGGLGPKQDRLVRKDDVRRIFETEHVDYEKPVFDAGAHHYGIIMKKQ